MMGLFKTKKASTPSQHRPIENVGSQPPSQEQQRWQDPNADATHPGYFQPAGYLPAPPGWNPPPSEAPPPYQNQRPCPPIVVNQHYYLGPPPPNGPQTTQYIQGKPSALSRLGLGSAVDTANDIIPGNIVNQVFDDGLPGWHGQATQLLNQGAALYDQIASKFNNVMTMIDENKFAGNEKDLFVYQPAVSPPSTTVSAPTVANKSLPKEKRKKDAPKGQTTAIASSCISGSYFAKVELYANSRLPMNLPPLKLYIPTYPLLCLAAHYSERVYEKPKGAERATHIDADWRTGTKAMSIKSVSMDHMNTIVFAIRGTATFMDWAVNLNTAPTSATGFLDEPGNLCHAGFLSVARHMIKPVAARLRHLLEENPRRASHSLLITGHSAGGAVASLLYSHMLATSKAAASELNLLTGCFKRLHCVTFGTPPISLLPVTKPHRPELKKSLFLSFVNEGDPVARADKAYVRSLLELLATPAPKSGSTKSTSTLALPSTDPSHSKKSTNKKSKSTLSSKESKLSMKSSHSTNSKSSKPRAPAPVWQVPPSTLSNAGRIIVLRSGDPKARLKPKKTVEERLNEGVVAQITSDEQLRGVIWGDPVCHVMKLYAGRIETLAVAAVTAQGH